MKNCIKCIIHIVRCLQKDEKINGFMLEEQLIMRVSKYLNEHSSPQQIHPQVTVSSNDPSAIRVYLFLIGVLCFRRTGSGMFN